MPRLPTPRFDERKAAQAAARFLESSGGTMDRLKFVKLMYLMDRKSLLTRGTPVTNDVYFSMPHGPVPSNVYNLVRHGAGNFWPQYIESPNNRTVVLARHPGHDTLSESELTIIDDLWDKYKDWHGVRLRNFTHQLPEFQDPGAGRIAIDIAEILAAEKSPAEAIAIERDLQASRLVKALFAGA